MASRVPLGQRTPGARFSSVARRFRAVLSRSSLASSSGSCASPRSAAQCGADPARAPASPRCTAARISRAAPLRLFAADPGNRLQCGDIGRRRPGHRQNRVVVEYAEGRLVGSLRHAVPPRVQLPQHRQLPAPQCLRALHAEVGGLLPIWRAISGPLQQLELFLRPASIARAPRADAGECLATPADASYRWRRTPASLARAAAWTSRLAGIACRGVTPRYFSSKRGEARRRARSGAGRRSGYRRGCWSGDRTRDRAGGGRSRHREIRSRSRDRRADRPAERARPTASGSTMAVSVREETWRR